MQFKKWSIYDLIYVVTSESLNGGNEKNKINVIPSIFMNSEVETMWISLIGWHHKTSNIYWHWILRLYIHKALNFLTSIDLCLNDLLLFSAFWSLFSIWDFNSFLYWKSRANNSFIAESTANLRASSCFLHCKNCSVRRLE